MNVEPNERESRKIDRGLMEVLYNPAGKWLTLAADMVNTNSQHHQSSTETQLSAEQNMSQGSPFTYSALFVNFRLDCKAAVLEFIGTAFFLLFGLGGIQAATAETEKGGGRQSSTTEQVMYIATSMGLSLLVSAWLFFRVTGGLFNPNISLALLLVGALAPVRFVLYCIAQLLGAIAGAAILRSLTSAPLSVK